MGLMVVHGAQAGGFSPISIYGGITNGVVAKAGLPLNEMATFVRELRRQPRGRAAALLRPRRPQAAAGGGPADAGRPSPCRTSRSRSRPTGPQIFGDAEAEALTEEIGLETGQADRSITAEPRSTRREDRTRGLYQIVTLAGLVAARGPRPRLQARHRLRRDHDRPRPVADGAEPAEARHGPGRLARDHADHRREHLRRRAREDGHDRLRRRQRRRPRLAAPPRCCSASSARWSRPSPPRRRCWAR